MVTPIEPPDGAVSRSQGHHAAYTRLRRIAEDARDYPGQWVSCEELVLSRAHSAKMLAYRIRSGRKAAFNDVGTFEATWTDNEDGTYAVLVKYVAA